MINLIDSAITSRVTTCLPWLERWAGLVIPVQRKVQAGDGWALKTFPVACGLPADCEDESKYQRVLPNSAYKSVGYLFQVGAASTRITGPKQSIISTSYRLRFVAWLNYQKLGVNDCAEGGAYELELIATLRKEFSIISDQLSTPGTLRLSGFSIMPKDPAQVFGVFTQEQQNIYFWPYGFMGIEFDASAQINANCLTALEAPSDITCLTEW